MLQKLQLTAALFTEIWLQQQILMLWASKFATAKIVWLPNEQVNTFGG